MPIRGPIWIRYYVGIPFKENGYTKEGTNCWGLVYLVCKERLSILLPKHDEYRYCGRQDARRASEVLERDLPNIVEDQWYAVDIRTTQYRLGDVIILRLLGRPLHIAICVSSTHMLHQEEGCNSVCEEISSPIWNSRIHSVYRHITSVRLEAPDE